MKVRDYLKKIILENIDTSVYEKAKENIRKESFRLLSILFTCLFVIFFILGIVGMSLIEISFVAFLVHSIPLCVLAIIFHIKSEKNKKEILDEDKIMEEYISLKLREQKILKPFFDLEYDDSIINFNITRRYNFGEMIIDYNEQHSCVRIFYNRILYPLINLKDIIEYYLIDEENEIYRSKKGQLNCFKNIIYNRFKCNRLELKILHLNEKKAIKTSNFLILKDINRKSLYYEDTINSLLHLFNIIDSEILTEYTEENHLKSISVKVEKNDVAVEDEQTNNCKNQEDLFEKLMKLKKLYDEGIIDKETYESKKKKIVDLL